MKLYTIEVVESPYNTSHLDINPNHIESVEILRNIPGDLVTVTMMSGRKFLTSRAKLIILLADAFGGV